MYSNHTFPSNSTSTIERHPSRPPSHYCGTSRSSARAYFSVHLPYESYKGAVVGSHYQLQQLKLQSDFLDIYSVTCLCSSGNRFEAQAFSLSLPRSPGRDSINSNSVGSSNNSDSSSSDSGSGSGGSSDDDGDNGISKLLASRRRRMRRIYRSRNFVGSFERGDKRFLVSRVTRSDAEWREVCRQIRRNQQEESRQQDDDVRCPVVRTQAGMSQETGKPRGSAKEPKFSGPGCRRSTYPMSSPDQVSSVPSVTVKCT